MTDPKVVGLAFDRFLDMPDPMKVLTAVYVCGATENTGGISREEICMALGAIEFLATMRKKMRERPVKEPAPTKEPQT